MQKNQSHKQTLETEVANEIYAAINRNDIQAVLKCLDPEIMRIEPEGFPSSGTYRGHAEFEKHVWQARATWAEGGCTPEEFIVNGDKVVVFVHVLVRLKDKTDWIDGRIADGFAFRNGKATEMHTFIDRQKALEWAGIEPKKS